jgi:curved DNA-binding protein CbpA
MSERDPYAVLGVGAEAGDAAIRDAYRRLAKRYHPDLNPGDAEAERRFKEIAAAYDLLCDRDRRAALDRGGDPGMPPGALFADEREVHPALMLATFVALLVLLVAVVRHTLPDTPRIEYVAWVVVAALALMYGLFTSTMNWVESRHRRDP